MIQFTVEWLGEPKQGTAQLSADGNYLLDTVQIDGIEMNPNNKALFTLHVVGDKVKIQ